MARPCPFISCEYHLIVEVTRQGGLRLNRRVRGKRPHLSASETDPAKIARFQRQAASAIATADPEWSCALDVARRGGHTLEEIGEVFRLCKERVKQLDHEGRDHMREELVT